MSDSYLKTEVTAMFKESESVIVAPNQCRIKARVLRFEQAKKPSKKLLLEFEVVESISIFGPNFAHAGKQYKGFTVEAPLTLCPGNIIVSEAEFLGDSQAGQFQLTRIMPVS
ncbi:MAG TPA: hypothetical protein VJL89_02460 [Thermodesulfovibrionia bacterium]|nr:hypothetical protein [Thermodesulfovibrionia bacterium]